MQNSILAQSNQANFDESKVGNFILPKLLLADNGKIISTARDWEKIQRPSILKKFEENVYGRIPGKPKDIHYKVEYSEPALNGKAIRKEVTIYFTKDETGPSINMLLYLPGNTGPVPIFVGLNFEGNHTIDQDTGIKITDNWKRIYGDMHEIARGNQSKEWPVEEIINSGYGVATAFYWDLEPDENEGWKMGVRGQLQNELNIHQDEWGAISVWAWGLSRMMDYLETDTQVNAKQVALIGHSRLGKAALWAASNDERFAIVISNESGEGGAALARRNYGETVELINNQFPHWFIDKYKTYNRSVDKLPVDQHMLLALMAPRPLYVASAVEDQWADPKGEFLSAKYAGEVYGLFGKKGIETEEQPELEQPVGDYVRYHIRKGKHDITLYDWKQYIQFANEHFK